MEDEIQRFERAVARFSEALTVAGNSGNQTTISVNAGGIGVVIASACCAFMFAVVIIGGAWFSSDAARRDREVAEIREDQRATKAYLQGIWQQAPYLKPEQSEKKK